MHVDVWICSETDSSRKPSLDELSASKDFEMGPNQNGSDGARFGTLRVQMISDRFDTYAYTPRPSPLRRHQPPDSSHLSLSLSLSRVALY
eukprot:7377550-Prymnesium_polylepis.1